MNLFKGISARAVAGFTCQQGFLFGFFYSGSNRAVDIAGISFERIDLLLTFAFLSLAFAIAATASRRARRALLAPTLVGWYAVLLVVGSLLFVLPFDASLAAVTAEGALVGLPCGFLLCAWGRALTVATRFSGAREILLATALGAALSFAMATIPTANLTEVLNLLPVGSALALRSFGDLSRDATFDAGVQSDARGEGAVSPRRALTLQALVSTPEERAAASRLSAKVVAGTVLFGLAGGFMEVFSSEPGMASNPAFPATLLIVVLFCVAAFQLYGSGIQSDEDDKEHNGQEGSLAGVYRTAILLIMAGYLFIPVLEGFGITGQSVTLAGYLGLTSVLMTLFLTIARASGRDAASTFARGLLGLFLGEIVGIALGNALELAQPDAAQPYAVAACAGLASLFAYLFLFTERDYEELATLAGGMDLFDRACERIASEFGLSKREAEVLPLALRGRTSERIASELCIAKSTVDTHLRRIYSKTGVHSRQELIDVSERIQQSLR